MMNVRKTNDTIEATEHDLERLLVTHAEDGIPEVLLVELLRDYATIIETIGYVPRRWGVTRRPVDQYHTRTQR